MKKKYCGILLGAALFVSSTSGMVSVLAAEETPIQMVAAENTAGTEETVRSYLTGEQVSAEIGRRRPVAVMLGNTQAACPQSGIGNAGVIYEAPVEGNMTRLMAIIEDYESLEKIGSVRSCRDYYLFYANEFDSIYAHFGQAAYALPYLNEHTVDNLNGIHLDGSVYFRTTDRVAPHNAYASGATLTQGILDFGYRNEYKEGYTGHYQFMPEGSENLLEAGTQANIIKLDCYGDNHPWFEYDGNTKKYSRFQFGAPQVDELTNEQLTCDNIILQYSNYQPYESGGYLNIDTQSGGAGKFITRGKAIDIRWEKDSQWGITRYYDTNNQEIQLNSGKTWVEIVFNEKLDSVTYQ